MTSPSEQAATAEQPAADDVVSVDTKPKAGQRVLHSGQVFTTIKEGLAHILIPADAPTQLDTQKHQKAQKEGKPTQNQSVFYNPIQQFNRDLSVLAIRAYSEHVIASRELKAKKSREKRSRKQKVKNDVVNLNSEQPSAFENGVKEAVTEELHAAGSKRKADEQLAQEQDETNPAKRQRSNNAHAADLGQLESARANADSSTNGAKPPDPRFVSDGKQQKQGGPRIEFSILDALSATGLRALRYAQEIPEATSITANDLSPGATASIKLNVEHNRLTDKIQITTSNAMSHMYSFIGEKAAKYDVIDLDPYGTAVPFLDGAIQALNDGGLLCVTCTDAGVWASNGYPEKTFSLYGGNPIKGRHSHEGGLRLILNALATTAAKYSIAIEPLMSLSIDFYARVFVRTRKSADHVKHLAGKTMLVYSCDSGCGSFKTQIIGRNTPMTGKDGKTTFFKHGMAQAPSCGPRCEHCGFKMHLAGPMWAGPLHNPSFLERLLQNVSTLDKNVYGTMARVEGMVSTALEETVVEDYPEFAGGQSGDAAEQDGRLIPSLPPFAVDNHPFFFVPANLAGVVHAQAPGELPIKGALRHAGFRAARSHTQPGSIRTNAPWEFIWEMIREWVRQKHPIKEGALTPTSAGYGIMRMGKKDDADGIKGEASGDKQSEVAEETKEEVEAQQADKDRDPIVFDEKLGRDREKRKLVRYQMNPRENWGPMNRAAGR